MANIITLDYELFGSGKGDVIDHLINPTNKILDVLSLHDIKATFFIEILEVDAFISQKRIYPYNNQHYKAAVFLENQIERIVTEGHDVQLHVHPQWYGAERINDEWHLNFDFWSFADLPFKQDGLRPGKLDLIKYSKDKLESLIRLFDNNYTCRAFRAGGYNIGNNLDSIQALLENGIVLDSSVCPGFFSNGLSNFDFTSAPIDLPYWDCSESILRPSSTGECAALLELPLLTINTSFFQKLSFARLLSNFLNRKFKSVNHAPKRGAKLPAYPQYFKNSNFDFCLASGYEINTFIKKINELRKLNTNHPLVMIGHPKDYNYFSPLAKILREFDSYITVADFIHEKRSFYVFK